VADSDCPLTDRELRDRANTAEAFAKKAGRNCIATYRGGEFEADALYVAAPGRVNGAVSLPEPAASVPVAASAGSRR
jgi:hypothetical protein